MSKKRGILLFFSILFFLVMGSGCGEQKETLNVYNWGEYIDTEVIGEFEKEFNCKVNYETFNTNEDMYLKLKKSGSNYDVIFPSDYMIEKMIKEDMLLPIDHAKIQNYKEINPAFTKFDFDEQNKYAIPYMWGTLGILYNPETVKEDIGSWDLLWNKNYEKKILMLNSVRDTFACALNRLGYSINSVEESEIEAAKALLEAQKPLVKAYVVDQVKTIMINDEADIAATWSGEAMYIIESNPKLKYFVPESGSNIWFDNMAIPKTTQNEALALKFIDFMCRADIAKRNSEYIGYATANMGAFNLMDEETKNNPLYYPSQDILDQCEVFKDLGENIKMYDKAWTEIKAD